MFNTLKRYIQNFPGKSTNRKFVVVESDDWGSIKMPSHSLFEKLKKEGYKPEKDPYLKYDSLASEEDFQGIFEVLNSVKDKNGNPAKITANAVVANPDFSKIRENKFEKYEYESFLKTLDRYPKHAKSFDLWKEGIEQKLFWPQYHGREHINVFQWMKSLKENDKNLRYAFENEMISISSLNTGLRFGHMEGLDYFSEEERQTKAAIIKDGMNMFEDIFGYKSLSFIANCYIWDDLVEQTLSQIGVKYLQGISNQCIPKLDVNNNHSLEYKTHYFGEKNKYGQRYFFRNTFFEPSLFPETDWVADC
jgi:hypothetical protein